MRNSSAPVLTIAISTLGERSKQISLPDPFPGIHYMVLIQRAKDTSTLCARKDLTVARLDSLGVAASRNAALAMAQTPFLLFSDDDIALDLSGISRLCEILDSNPDLAVVTGQCTNQTCSPLISGYRLRHWNSARTGTPEIMVRRALLRTHGIRFDTRFGIGARYGLGEEFVFLTDMLKAGLKGRHEPIRVGYHPSASTGDHWNSIALLRARVAVLTRVFGHAAPLVRLAFAWRHRAHLRNAPGGVAAFIIGRYNSEP